MQAIEDVEPSLGVQAIAVPVRTTADIKPALAEFARQPNGGLITTSDEFIRSRHSLIAGLAARYRLPSIGPFNFAKNGGLMNYSTDINLIGQYRQAAGYVDRILKGAKPGDLPIQEADRYTFIINLKGIVPVPVEFGEAGIEK
jgi:putative tryptophan/tyrosine transport system substrate-binding protein